VAPTFQRNDNAMGLSHCPLCMGLAMLCAVRFLAHGILLWQLRPLEDSQPQLQAA